jgi:hypothetical protein
MFSPLDRFAIKQLGSSVDDNSLWPGGIKVYTAKVATAVAPVAAVPTTAAHAALWNGNNAASGKHLVILAAGTVITVSAGAAIVLNLLGCVTTVPVTSMSGTAASTITPLTAPLTDTYGGSAQFKSAVTITNNGLWVPLTQGLVCAGTANIGLGVHADLNGRYVVPPGHQFCLASFASAAGTAECVPYVIWAEVTFKTGL